MAGFRDRRRPRLGQQHKRLRLARGHDRGRYCPTIHCCIARPRQITHRLVMPIRNPALAPLRWGIAAMLSRGSCSGSDRWPRTNFLYPAAFSGSAIYRSQQRDFILILDLVDGPRYDRGRLLRLSAALRGGCIMTDKLNIVLVHGAFGDGSHWRHIIPRLYQAGHRVMAAQNPLTSWCR
jgi:hypothetical protein